MTLSTSALRPACPLDCSVVIATLDRVASLQVVLTCLARQTRLPLEVIISAAGDPEPIKASVRAFPGVYPVIVLAAQEKSSARQRNQAAAIAKGQVIAFLDDDIEFSEDLFARILPHFDAGGPGAISARIAGNSRPEPGRLTRWYYRLQSGYDDPDYGGRLFGAGINCEPIFHADSPELLESEWLPSTCLFVDARLFHVTKFPAFTGYSFAEDVHLTARIARSAPVYFATQCTILHHSLPSEFKANRAALNSGNLHNMGIVAREVLNLYGWPLWWRWQLHRLFLAAVIMGQHLPQWRQALLGVWRAKLNPQPIPPTRDPYASGATLQPALSEEWRHPGGSLFSQPIHRLIQGISSRGRYIIYRMLGVDFRARCWLRAIEIPRNWNDITLHGCALDRGVVLLCSGAPRAHKIEIGHGTYINRFTIIDAHERISLGRDVMIGPHTFITDGSHGMAPGTSVKSQRMTASPVTIEDEVWIGAQVTILSGVRIGRGAVIGAGSVVTHDIPADVVAFGAPARVHRRRDGSPVD